MSMHHFALYAEEGQYQVLGRLVHIDEPQLRFRMINILRVAVGDVLTLFDDRQALTLKIAEVGKQYISADLLSSTLHVPAPRKIDILLPLLDKEALEFAIEYATIHQISRIQLVSTHASRTGLRSGEHDRLIRIMRAAQEQSKQFVAPEILQPISLEQACGALAIGSPRFLASVNGVNIEEQSASMAAASHMILTVGPEADYTAQEYQLLNDHHFVPIVLGNSVLRACYAAALLCGLVRTIQCKSPVR